MSDFKASLRNWPLAVFFAFFPSWAIRGPFAQTIRKWDELLAGGQKVVAIGNADAHGTPSTLVPSPVRSWRMTISSVASTLTCCCPSP